jgi:hypothetical protein
MKKLFAIIFLLGISIPAVASEVTLECQTVDNNGKVETEIWSFDEAAGTVYVIVDGIKKKMEHGYITREAIGVRGRSVVTGSEQITTISRATGNYSYVGQSLNATGKCTPFQQAF